MSRIIFLGNSVACAAAIEQIRNADEKSEIIFFPLERCLPYKRECFTQFIAKEIKFKELLYKPQDFYQKRNVQIIPKAIDRINFRKNQVFTEDKEAVAFDFLVIANTVDFKFPDIKGANKAGVCAWKKLDDINRIFDDIGLLDTVVVEGEYTEGLRIAQAFQKRGKEVILIAPAPPLASENTPHLNSEASAVTDELKEIRIITDQKIAEILGEGDAKAVRLSSGKVLAAQLIIFTEANFSFRFLTDTPLQINKKISVNSEYKTNLKSVFAVDEACEVSGEVSPLINNGYTVEDLVQQGNIVAAQILNQHQPASENLSQVPS